MAYFSIRNIILQHFHVDINESKSYIDYDMIIGRDLMLQLELMPEFKYQFLQWDGDAVLMK